jgi:hypothetical protein
MAETKVTAKEMSIGGNYSTSEVDTGFTWTDGKAIYKRTFSGTVTYSSNVRFSGTILSSAGIETLIRSEGSWVSGSNKIPIGNVFPTATGQLINISMMVYVSGTNLAYVGTTGDSGSGAYNVTIYYTKSS